MVETHGHGADPASDVMHAAASADLVASVLKRQDSIREWQENVYRTLHEHPELSNQEVDTAATATKSLRDDGFEVHDKVGTTGSSASFAMATGQPC